MHLRLRLSTLTVLFTWISLIGCSAKRAESFPYAEQQYQQAMALDYLEAAGEDVSLSHGRAHGALSVAPGVTTRSSPAKGAMGGVANQSKKEGVTQEAQPQRPQSVHYNGFASLRVSRTDESADDLGELAKEVGGHVEELNPSRVTIRVPVETFETVFAQILTMGDVLEKSISATDISESLTSVDLRLNTARATRDRLVKLLAKAEDENEKMELIRQIQRLTEDIDRLSGQSQTLHNLAAMSRITVHLTAREALSNRHAGSDIGELAWIHKLIQFKTHVSRQGKRLELETPEGFVELSPKDQFVVESADGARLWTGQLENQPQGDTDFWLSAIEGRLADESEAQRSSSKGTSKCFVWSTEKKIPTLTSSVFGPMENTCIW